MGPTTLASFDADSTFTVSMVDHVPSINWNRAHQDAVALAGEDVDVDVEEEVWTLQAPLSTPVHVGVHLDLDVNVEEVWTLQGPLSTPVHMVVHVDVNVQRQHKLLHLCQANAENNYSRLYSETLTSTPFKTFSNNFYKKVKYHEQRTRLYISIIPAFTIRTLQVVVSSS